MALITGKGMYIWQVKACEGGSIPKIVAEAKKAGLSHVLVKACDGAGKFNMRPGPNGTWIDDILPALVPALKAAGLKVWGWQYIYLAQPAQEAAAARARIAQLGLDGWVIDAESEAKGKAAAATAYMTGLKGLVSVPLALSSYRYPSVHPDFPWAPFLRGVDMVMPQVYWMGATNAGAQLIRSRQDYKNLLGDRQIEYLPTGAAFTERGWTAAPGEVKEFMDTAKALGLPGVNFWSWQHARALPGMWEVIANYPWSPAPTPEPEPSQVPVDQWVVNYLYPWAKSEGYQGPAPIITNP